MLATGIRFVTGIFMRQFAIAAPLAEALTDERAVAYSAACMEQLFRAAPAHVRVGLYAMTALLVSLLGPVVAWYRLIGFPRQEALQQASYIAASLPGPFAMAGRIYNTLIALVAFDYPAVRASFGLEDAERHQAMFRRMAHRQ